MSHIIGNNSILPIEIILNILYKYKGFEHPISKILKNDIKCLIKNKCFYCNKKKLLPYYQYHILQEIQFFINKNIK